VREKVEGKANWGYVATKAGGHPRAVYLTGPVCSWAPIYDLARGRDQGKTLQEASLRSWWPQASASLWLICRYKHPESSWAA
jgi:hypothetical protein